MNWMSRGCVRAIGSIVLTLASACEGSTTGAGGDGGQGADQPGGGGADQPGGSGQGAQGAQGGGPVGGGGEGGQGAEGGGGGGPAAIDVCPSPLRCVDASTYFCDEITGPDDGGVFEAACTEQGGTFTAEPCSNNANFFWSQACLFDCVTPNEYSSIGLDQAACEDAGGTFFTNSDV